MQKKEKTAIKHYSATSEVIACVTNANIFFKLKLFLLLQRLVALIYH